MPVYFIQAGESGPVKIGSTVGMVEGRLASLQTAHHEKLRILRVLAESGRQVERKLHHIYRTRKVQGEWFRPHWSMFKVKEESLLEAVRKDDEWKYRLGDTLHAKRRKGAKQAHDAVFASLPIAYSLAGLDGPEFAEHRLQLEKVLNAAISGVIEHGVYSYEE